MISASREGVGVGSLYLVERDKLKVSAYGGWGIGSF